MTGSNHVIFSEYGGFSDTGAMEYCTISVVVFFFLLEDENKNPVIEWKVQISLMKLLPFYH